MLNKEINKTDKYLTTDMKLIKKTINWTEDFLTDRKQKVCIKDKESKEMDVISGIPQGSVLGPLLFVLYINDLPDGITSQLFLFADDTKIYRTITDKSDKDKLQLDLQKLQDWSDKWLLRFHPDKCKAMTIGRDDDRYNYHLTINNSEHYLEFISEEKDIGVIIDSDLEFDKHINTKVNKANSMFGLIRRTFTKLTPKMFVSLYKVLVRCHLDFASSVYSPYKIKHIDQLENMQRRATKQIPGLRELEYPERLKTLKLPTLAYRRLEKACFEKYAAYLSALTKFIMY